MSDYLKLVDKSKNMEDLRSARSYNDIVVVLSRIKVASSNISSRMSRLLGKTKNEAVEIGIAPASDKKFTVDTKSIKQAHEDLRSVIEFSYELQFCKSLSSVIASESKMDKFRKMLESVDRTRIVAENIVYKYLNSIGRKIAPTRLDELANAAEKHLSKLLKFQKLSTFVIPTQDDRISFIRYIVLHNVQTPSGYVLSEFLVALHADNDFDDGHFYSVSFPARVDELQDKQTFSTKKQMTAIVSDAVTKNFNMQSISGVAEPQLRLIETMPHVISVAVEGGQLSIELEAGLAGSAINAVLTKILAVAQVALGVQDPRTDIIHRVATGPKGNKIVRIAVSNRNFYDMEAINRLKKMLPMSADTFKAIKALVGS